MKNLLFIIFTLFLLNAHAGRFLFKGKGYRNDQNITFMIGQEVQILNGPARGQRGRIMAVMEGGGEGQVKVKIQDSPVEHFLFIKDVQRVTRFD